MDKVMIKGGKNQQTARAGEYYVAAELNRRGAYAVTFAGNMPNIDIVASNMAQTRTVNIQVKTKRRGTWQSTIDKGKRTNKKKNELNYWIFLSMEDQNSQLEFFIVPEWWIQNDIFKAHNAYLEKHGGKRKSNPDSKHHSITKNRIQQWKDRWDILKIV